MSRFWKRNLEVVVPAVPLTVSLALADLQTIPGPPEQLVVDYAERNRRPVQLLHDAKNPSGRLERTPNQDLIHLPTPPNSRQAREACLHQLAHLMIGHDHCLMGQVGLTGDDRLQELDATMFANLVLDRYSQVRRATGSSHPRRSKVTTAYVLGLLDDRWPRDVRVTN